MKTFYFRSTFLLCVGILVLSSFSLAQTKSLAIVSKSSTTIQSTETLSSSTNISIEQERCHIFTLAAYTVVFDDWQTMDDKNKRGHNIGCILVNEKNMPVAWERNCVTELSDATQHGEVRVIQKYISKNADKYLDGYTIYTTLEPCIMCSGMMSLTKVAYCVYGQKDGPNKSIEVGYGDAIERLKLDTYNKKTGTGYKPYPRTPKASIASDLSYKKELDALYKASDAISITDFLLSDQAKSIYAKAAQEFNSYKVIHNVNNAIYAETKKIIKSISVAKQSN